ncbi:MAG: hypothetical protein MUC87_13385 [Bacteroidia bacterium]|nr:hypothetical protein [Bacteroidia bacterium]
MISALNKFSQESKPDDLIERLIVIEKIDAGLNDIKEGKTVSHADVKQMVKKGILNIQPDQIPFSEPYSG